jgi:hypothetical protein
MFRKNKIVFCETFSHILEIDRMYNECFKTYFGIFRDFLRVFSIKSPENHHGMFSTLKMIENNMWFSTHSKK